MISGDILDNLRKNSQLYIKVGEGDYEPIGNCTNFELSCETGSLPKINLELIQIPTPDNPIPVAEQTRIVDISDLVQYEPYEPIGKNLFNELKIDNSGITLTCESLRNCDDTIDAMRYCVEDIKNTNKYLEKKEGKDMKLLNIYVEKSEKNIKDYYQNLIEMEEKNDIVKQDYDYVVEKYKKDMKELAERYNELNSPTGSFITIEPAFGMESRFKVVHKTTEKEEMYHKLCNDELKQLHDKIDEINAQLEMVDMFGDENNCDYDTVQAILVEYGVINENGRLTSYNPTFVNEEAPVKEAPKKAGRPKKVSK